MKVLFCGMRWDYKRPERGPSFEYTNFWDALSRFPGIEPKLFPFDELEAQLGREGMNQALWEEVQGFGPDLVFFFMFTDEFDPQVVSRITSQTVTVNWFADDQWRFGTYSRHWAPHLSWVATTDQEAADGYRSLGYDHVIKTQWGCNHHLYRPLSVQRDIEVSFVGQPHGTRPQSIQAIRDAGHDVQTWGHGWENGRLTQEDMIEVFSRSRINLNLSNASRASGLADYAALVLRRKGSLIVPRVAGLSDRLKEFRAKGRDQIKGRNFEIPGCRTFMLTSYVEGLEDYFVPNQELVTFTDTNDLLAKLERYLHAPEETEAIAEAAYRRTLADHTYETRFASMFSRMGLL